MMRRILFAISAIALGMIVSITRLSAQSGETVVRKSSGDQAQSSESRPSFEVASIKLSAACEGNNFSPIRISPGRINLRCHSLYTLVMRAYGHLIVSGNINPHYAEIVGGPDWVKTLRYDIDAKAEGLATAEQMTGPMLQMLLEDRFKLKVHKEVRNGPVYEMTAVKKSENLQPSKEGSCTPIDLNNDNLEDRIRDMVKKGGSAPRRCGSYTSHNTPLTFSGEFYGYRMADLVYLLRNRVGLPVIDKTELAGRFDFHLEFAFEMEGALANGMSVPPATEAAGAPIGPSIFDALRQQLGLKLTKATGPREVMVIDHAEKASAN